MNTRRQTLIGVVTTIFVFTANVLAMDHGWNKADPFVQWAESLKRPDRGYVDSCCGKGDLYEIKITEDAIGDEPTDNGTAEIVEGSALTFPDGTKRQPIENGTKFNFQRMKVNYKQGNPTGKAWGFLNVVGGRVTAVWCIIPLPGSV